ncbi:SUMF1/EgtB/PvdO family nonheme iron enzyme [candidate division KSB1 bacterium]|nr:SUMF1/EgtB/PvdO family nonheme iron enzyme [candidate division KSB1 bacterium]
MSDIFISYARSDQPVAQKLAESLTKLGWSVWWDQRIPAGKTFSKLIERELKSAKCIIVLWSAESISHYWVQEEAEEGRKKGILVPVLIQDVEPPLGFRQIQTANLVNWDGKVDSILFKQLVSDMSALIGPAVHDDDKQSNFSRRFFSDVEGGAEYILIPGGEYVMGELQMKVKVEPFYLAKFAVTNRLYRKFLEGTKYREPEYWKDKRFNGDEQPVVGVSWNDAKAYCEWLTRSNPDGQEFRLSYESEWEWAAGRGVRNYPWGNDLPTKMLANFGRNVGYTTQVGSYPAGATLDGLMDMAGNVWEWCGDKYRQESDDRVLRGGSWSDNESMLQCSYRDGYYPSGRLRPVIGFRVARLPSH